MIDLPALQKRVYENKIAKGFNVTDICMEFCYTQMELTEAMDAYIRKKGDVGEELADVVIYLLGLSEILGINLEEKILAKVDKNEKRKYAEKNGILMRIDNIAQSAMPATQ